MKFSINGCFAQKKLMVLPSNTLNYVSETSETSETSNFLTSNFLTNQIKKGSINNFKNEESLIFSDCTASFDNKNIILKGRLGSVKIEFNRALIEYKNKIITDPTNNKLLRNQVELRINKNLISPQNLALLHRLIKGINVGYRRKLYQSGVWTILDSSSTKSAIQFKLGYSHLSEFKLPIVGAGSSQGFNFIKTSELIKKSPIVLYRSRREGQFRIINLYSLCYSSVTETAKKLRLLKPADPYRLNGFRYALFPKYGHRASNIKMKVGKKK